MVLLNLGILHSESTELGKQYATNTFHLIAASAEREISSRIDPILDLTRTAASLPPPRDGAFTWSKSREDFFRSSAQSLNAHPNILAVNYGYADGSFFSVTALRDASVIANYGAPPTAIFAIWAVADDETGTRREWWSFLDENYNEVGSRVLDPVYDPRKRSWYKEATRNNAFTMTAPYIFKTSKELGFAVAMPLRGTKGVFSVNITLRNFDSLLDNSLLTNSGYLFILDEKKRILGERSPQMPTQPMTAKTPPNLSELSHQLLPLELHPTYKVSNIVPYLDQCQQNESAILINLEGADYFLACQKVPMGDQQVEIVMLSPVHDFTGVMESFFTRTVFFAVITMLIFVPVAVWLSFKVGAALKSLLRETLMVKHLQWGEIKQVTLPIWEIRRLAHAITSMRRSIHKRTDALKQEQNSLETKVQTRTAELSHALELAREATQAKSKFLSTVSHEIRTPMNAIVGFTYLFNKDNLTDKQKDYLDKIRISSETLLRIINDVLDFSKIEAGRLEIEHIPFHLDTVIDTVVSITTFPAKEKCLEFIVERDADVPEMLAGDPTRLHQILLNLMSNAIKFTDTGHVKLGVSKARNQPSTTTNGLPDVALLFSVSDTGIGMTEEQTQRIFSPFGQADNSITRKYGGTGLGLAICKQLAELMKGSIRVLSPPGQGTLFEVVVVLSALSETSISADNTTVETQAIWQRGALVLVVDDNAINREIAGALLESADLLVDFAENGVEAIEKIQKKRYDLVFMDMQMPVMDGLQAARSIRALPEGIPCATTPREVPIIAMTANAMTEDRHRCMLAGMNDHISKPIVPTTLLDMLGLWLPPQDPPSV